MTDKRRDEWFDRIGIDLHWKHRALIAMHGGFVTFTVDPACGTARIWIYDLAVHTGTVEALKPIYKAIRDAHCRGKT